MSGEREPLLPLPAKQVEDGDNSTFLGEFWISAKSSLPVAMTYMLQNALQTGSIIVVGRLGPAELSAAANAFMIATVTGWSVALGGSTALDTLASSLYTAKGTHLADVGILLQRCILVLLVLFIPAALLWIFVRPVLLVLGQPEELAINVQLFLRILLAGAPFYLGFEAVKKFLQVQGIMHASTLVLLVVAPANIALNILFVHTLDNGFPGAAIATSISYFLAFAGISLYAYLSRARECWGGFSGRAFQGWPVFLSLAVPGILMIGTEYVAFEIVALAAGNLGELALSAQSVIMTVDAVINTIPLGIGVASTARIGNLLGYKAPKSAEIASNATVAFSTVIQTTILVILLATRHQFAYMFSDDAATAQLVAQVMPWVAAFQIADGWAASCNGILRGIGKQHVGAWVNLVAYYVVALPGGIALAFKAGTGLSGLWIAQCVALYIVGIGAYFYIYQYVDWSVEVTKAIDRNKEEEAQTRAIAELVGA